jgi:hypothetical protein
MTGRDQSPDDTQGFGRTAPTQSLGDIAGQAIPSRPTSPPSTLDLGAVADRYKIERIAGEGGMGRVFRAFDTRLNRPVAIKLLRAKVQSSSASGNSAALRSVIAEARSMAALNHPGLCRVIDVVTDAPEPFIVMEWIDGISLKAAWAPMALDERLSLYRKVLDAISAAHGAGFVHRDLKPDNILVRAGGEPIIVDFGLSSGGHSAEAHREPHHAKETDADTNTNAETNTSGGTPGYSAPEQFSGVHVEASRSADVYALGVMLYEMLTGRLPFIASTPLEWLQLARDTDPPLPETFAPECPTDLERICLCAMERDPARRYPTARELAADVRRFAQGEGVTARPSQLANQFAAQVESHVAAAGQWSRLGLVSPAEAEALTRFLRRLQRPESPWIIDSRRLTHAQVGLYLGGWLLIIGMTIGFWRSWADLNVATRAILPGVLSMILLGFGVWMHRSGHQRSGLPFLITASLGFPVALALMLRQTGWLSAPDVGSGTAELFARVRDEASGWIVADPPPSGLFNLQIWSVMVSWLVIAAALRVFAKANAFSAFAVVALLGTWAATWLVGGGLTPPRDERTFAMIGAWFVPLAIILGLSGAFLSNSEEKLTAILGHHRARRSDSWPVLIASTLCLVLSLGLIAYFRPTWFGLPVFVPEGEPVARRAVAFTCSGMCQLALSWFLALGPGTSRTSAGKWLRWTLPSHTLAPLIILHVDDTWGLARVWLAAVFVASLLLCFVSVWKQWKPFFANGLVYFAIAYFHLFDDPAVQESPLLHHVFTIGIFVIGLAIMLLAWWLPGKIDGQRLNATLRRVGTRVPRGGSR